MLNDRQLKKYIGLKIGGGIIVGARALTIDTVEFNVYIDGEFEPHRISTKQGA